MDEKIKDTNSEKTADTPNEEIKKDIENISQEPDEIKTDVSEETSEDNGKKDKKSKKDEKKEHREIADLKKQLEEAQQKISEAEDKYLRVMAEYDNFRKRSARELESRYSDAYSDALSQILPVIDNIERASMYKESDKVVDGIAMIVKTFPDTLSKLGVEAFGTEGDEFDPNLHNAVMQVEDENRKEGEIVSVLQKGYKREDKVIRYAMVTVAN